MLLLEANQFEKSYGDRLIIKAEQLQVYHGERIGVVGKNGEGKSTLLKMLAGELKPDTGRVQLFCPFTFIPQLEVQETEEMTAKLKNQWRIPDGNIISGGEETRKKIAAALSSDAKLLIADEPTSHLDVSGVSQFEKEVKQFNGSVILISHDRELLNQVCTSIWEVENGSIHCYEGNYQDYLEQKEHIKARQQFEYEQYVKEKQRLAQAAVERSEKSNSLKKAPSRMGNSEARLHKRSVGTQKAKLDKGVKAIETRIEQLEKKEKPKEIEEVAFDLSQFNRIHSKVAISFQQVHAKIGSRVLFSQLKGDIKPGSKVAVVGNNGTGKSTLLHLIESGHDGITVAKPVKLGFFHQRLENLDENKTILENIKEDSPYSESFIRTVLSRLLFKREDVHKKVHLLSGGERVKTALAKVFLGNYNVLLLDEPTNYLDLQTKEALHAVLKVYPGTVVFVTHDRYFVKQLATHVLTLENEKGTLKPVGELDQKKKPVKKQVDEAALLMVEMELTETISKLSIVTDPKQKQELEEKYTQLLAKKKQLRS
ncbi:ABC-F type ribosomal protection protein [Priestia megaterium]|nr:ABC-F type ribosomal protection protein [Priestia megaterium]